MLEVNKLNQIKSINPHDHLLNQKQELVTCSQEFEYATILTIGNAPKSLHDIYKFYDHRVTQFLMCLGVWTNFGY